MYLKSDFSKNPNYVYRFSSSAVPWGDIFWGKDRYLQNYYLLQKEYDGVSLRINVYGGRFNVFDFQAGEKTSMYHDRLMSLGVLGVLVDFISTLKMKNWLVKFDVILGSAGYVVLDIGMDPPSRMLKESKASDVAFAKHYVDQYLYGRVDYPEALD